MRLTPVIAIAGLALGAALVAWAAAQSVAQPAGQLRIMPNLREPDFTTCVDALYRIDEPQQIACLAKGEISKYGQVVKTSATCTDAGYNKHAARCLSGYKLLDAYKGTTGPVCAVVRFKIAAAPPQKGRGRVSRTFLLEEYPCPASQAAPG